MPGQPGPVTGAVKVCAGEGDVAYSVAVVANAVTYLWSLPPGAAISSGAGTNITVNFGINAASGNISVYGNNSCGNGMSSPVFPITVNPVPPAPLITHAGDTLMSNAPFGNRWYYEGILLAGDTSQSCIAHHNGYYWDAVTTNACTSDTSNHILILITGVDPFPSSAISVYPAPNDGRFHVSISNALKGPYTIHIYNVFGTEIYTETGLGLNSTDPIIIDLRPLPAGVYTLLFENRKGRDVKKIVVNK